MQTLAMKKGACFSECNTYRYTLWRIWDESKPIVTFIGLNPSTADATNDDPTIGRCIQFAKSWGCGGIYMLNLFAYRSTDPKAMKMYNSPIGLKNDKTILDIAQKSKLVVACWGNHGSHLARSGQVRKLLGEIKLSYLVLNKTGEPKHPLYVKGGTSLKLF